MQYKGRYKLQRISRELANLYRNDTGTYVFRKAIPEKYRKLAGRREFKMSLRTKELTVAVSRYEAAKKAADVELTRLTQGIASEKVLSFEDASNLANSQGRELVDLATLLKHPPAFIETVAKWDVVPNKNPRTFSSLFNAGGNDIMLSGLVGCYEKQNATALRFLNETEYRRKLAPLKLACQEFTDHVGGDKCVSSLNRESALSYKKELDSRIQRDELAENAANKRLIAMRALIKTFYISKDVPEDEISTPFDKMKFEEKQNKREAFSREFIRDKWLKGDPFATLNLDARNLAFAMLDTGCHLKELCGLDPDKDIFLDADIPHIFIRVNSKRVLKTEYRERKIPLMGYALQAFKACPQGFTRYSGQNGHTSASQLINKFLKKNGLSENNACTTYSLRHLFKDRMREHSIPIDMQDYIMGHETPGSGANYGKGYRLKDVASAMKQLEEDFECRY